MLKMRLPTIRPGSAMFALPLCLLLGLAVAARAREDPGASEPNEVAARVGDDPIHEAELARLVQKALAGRQIDRRSRQAIRSQVLSEVVSRRLVHAYARRTQTLPSDDRIEAEVARIQSQLTARGRSLDQFLAEQSIEREDLRRQVTWNLLWQEYLGRYTTEDRAKAWFDRHRREVDGTELSVSHILLRPDRDSSHGAEALADKARQIRQAILAGELTFDEAAREHSAGPSADQGGSLGSIGRRGPMVESFTRAAFSLEPGEISEPVQTPFGIHLIRCDAVKPGTCTLAEVREEVDQALARELLEKIAETERRYTPVRIFEQHR